MTMLDRMRRHKGWLKWSLALVVLAFIVFYIPDFLDQGAGGASPNEVVAQVGDERITAGAFRRAYYSQLEAYRRAYGGSINEDLLRQMGIERQILQQLIDERAAMAEAERLGLTVTDQEVAQRIYAMPAFQDNGQFAGPQVYEQVLRMQRPPLTTAEFEDNLRRALLVEKLRAAVTDWVAVSDAEIEREYRRRNEKVELDLVVFSADQLRSEMKVTDSDVAAYFEKNKERYRIGETRKIRYLLVDVDALKAKAVIAPGDVERAYQQNLTQYQTPEQVRASHILLKTEGKDEAAVRVEAERILKQVKGGADFAALAKKHSEDEASAAQGGDLDYFGRGRMVKEFEDVAFSLEPGSVSDLVKSQFGFHVIKVTDRKPATTRPLEEVRAQIADQLAYERAQAQATDLAESLRAEINDASDLDRVSKTRGLTVQESGFFEKEEPIAGLGPAPEVADQAFTLGEGAVAGPIRVARGQVFVATVGRQDARLPRLDEVKERVTSDALAEKAREASRERAAALAPQFKSSFAAAAKAAGLTVRSTELVPRGSALPEVGINAAIDAAVFALPAGGVTDPIVTDAGTVVARVVERQEVSAGELEAARDGLRTELLNEQRSRFFSAYMAKARERMKTSINEESVRRVLG
jgi:peptidyl-prolyl cis-trans isomerase D